MHFVVCKMCMYIIPNNIDYDYFHILINFIMSNNFIMHNSKISLQTSGIAQGVCSSSMLADLFLYHYEYEYKNNLQLHRYIDDITLNFN